VKPTLRAGASTQFSFRVSATKTVPHLFPEAREFQLMPTVFATGFMVGLMEWTCLNLVAPHLDEGEGSLGVHINVSHIAATVPGYAVESWYGLYAPAGTPPDVIQKLSAAAKKAARSPEFAKRIEQEGLEVTATDPAELDRYVKAEEVRWRKIVKENNIKPE